MSAGESLIQAGGDHDAHATAPPGVDVPASGAGGAALVVDVLDPSGTGTVADGGAGDSKTHAAPTTAVAAATAAAKGAAKGKKKKKKPVPGSSRFDRGGRDEGVNSVLVEDAPTSSCARAAFIGLAILLFVCMFYAAGGWFLVMNLLNQTAHGLPDDPASPLYRLGFPLEAALGQGTTPDQFDNGLSNTNRLPFFTEALPFFLLSVMIEVVMAMLIARRKKLYRANDAVNSLSLGVLSQTWGIFFVATGTIPYVWLYNNVTFLHLPADSPWVWWLAFFAIDFCYYWFHRTSHHNNIWWGQHVVHHSSEEYNLTTALRQPGLGGIAFVFYLPLALFLPIQLAHAHKTFNLLYQFWIHTRLIGSLGPLEWVLNTPSHHRVHHGRNPYCIDRNFGGTLIIWDRLFGTFQAERKDVAIKFGKIPTLQTWNPVWANLDSYWDFIKALHSTPGCRRKCGMLCRGPGWRYDARKKKCRYFKVPRIGHKFNPKTAYDPAIASDMCTYALAQFSILALVFLVFRFLPHTFWAAATVAVVFAACLVSVSSVLDGRRWCLHAEALRLAASIAFAVVMARAVPALSSACVGFGVVCAISLGFVCWKLYGSQWHRTWLILSSEDLLHAHQQLGIQDKPGAVGGTFVPVASS